MILLFFRSLKQPLRVIPFVAMSMVFDFWIFLVQVDVVKDLERDEMMNTDRR